MMSESKKYSAVKLFGQTISQPLPPPHKAVSDESLSELSRSSSATSTFQDSKDEPPRDDSTEISTQSINPNQEKKSRTSSDSPKKDDESSQTSQEKPTLKKPDKLIPCPRCNSMDTKFCYYNNYNLNQPRHFCKNCQRYWTSGGTMRNVPIGSGRRRSKAYPIPETLKSARASDPSNGIHIPYPNGYLISPNGFPISFYPATLYWGSAPTSPVLGKHLRGGGLIRQSNWGNENLGDEIEKSVLIPKTLRIHDPREAAKSSIWSTLGIKNDKIGSLNGGSLFKAFVPKGDRQGRVDHKALVMKANPAALSRSVNFHETTFVQKF